METYIMVVGGHEWVKMFEADMSAQWWEREVPVNYNSEQMKKYKQARLELIENGSVKPNELPENPKTIKQRGKFQVREVKLLSIVHPEEYKEDVLKYFAPYNQWICYKIVKKIRSILRPIMKLAGVDFLSEDKLMKVKPHFPIKLINRYVRVIPLGQKKDTRNRDGEVL